MKPSQQQHSDECGPDLNPQRIFGSTDEGFNFEVLFERFEEDFNLPTLSINVGDSGRPEVEVVG